MRNNHEALLFTIAGILLITIGILIGYEVSSSSKGGRAILQQNRIPKSSPPILMRVTAYCPCAECCGRWADGITASGKIAEGMICAADKSIPFGTKFYVKGHGDVTVEDRGGGITDRCLDLLFPTHQEALDWGVQAVLVREVE